MIGPASGTRGPQGTTAGRRAPSERHRPAVLAGSALLLVLGLAALAATFNGSYIDDTYIQLQYVENLVRHHTWGFWPGRPANTATSPLNVVVTALFSLPFSSPVDAVVWVTCLELAAMFVLLLGISRRLFGSPFFGIVCFVALAANPLLLSTIGLEGTLFVLLVLASLRFFLSPNWPALAASLAALTLTRADGFLLFVVFLAFVPGGRTARGRFGLARRATFVLTYVAIQVPWYALAWSRLGSAVPDTLLVKLSQRWHQGDSFATGLALYWRTYPLATLLTFALLPLGALLVRERRREVRAVAAVLALYGVLHYLAYSALGVPPYHWYYLHHMVPAVVIGCLGIASLAHRMSLPAPALVQLGGAVLLLPVLGLVHLADTSGVPFREPPIHSNWATPARYREIGLWLRANLPSSSVVFMDGEIGTIGFYAERDLVNEFSDMSLATDLMVHSPYLRTPLIGPLLRTNLRHRKRVDPAPKRTHVLRHVVFDPAQAPPPEEVVMSWATATGWAPEGRLYLLRAP